MKAKEAVILALIVLLVAAIGASLANQVYTRWYLLDQTTIPVKFKVTEGAAIGFDLNSTVLSFGKVPQGQLARRDIYLNAIVPARASITVMPPLDRWLAPIESPVTIEPGEEQRVTMQLELPPDAPPGNYTGEIIVQYFRSLG